MKEKLANILLCVLLISTLFFNTQIHYYAFISLFLFFPYFIHVVNLSLRKKLAQKDNFMGREAQRQLVFFSSKGYKWFLFILTILLGIGLFIVYFVLIILHKPIELLNVILFMCSCAFLVRYLWQFYSILEN
jgi:hypothetical protein